MNRLQSLNVASNTIALQVDFNNLTCLRSLVLDSGMGSRVKYDAELLSTHPSLESIHLIGIGLILPAFLLNIKVSPRMKEIVIRFCVPIFDNNPRYHYSPVLDVTKASQLQSVRAQSFSISGIGDQHIHLRVLTISKIMNSSIHRCPQLDILSITHPISQQEIDLLFRPLSLQEIIHPLNTLRNASQRSDEYPSLSNLQVNFDTEKNVIQFCQTLVEIKLHIRYSLLLTKASRLLKCFSDPQVKQISHSADTHDLPTMGWFIFTEHYLILNLTRHKSHFNYPCLQVEIHCPPLVNLLHHQKIVSGIILEKFSVPRKLIAVNDRIMFTNSSTACTTLPKLCTAKDILDSIHHSIYDDNTYR